MKQVVVKIDPPVVDIEDVEDFLATDDLFVEYFNVFLALPTFPEPLCFNKDTGGFEVVSLAKKDLGKRIKEALRTQQRTRKIYRVAKKHSYIDIPLFPIEDAEGQENPEINTTFVVTTLNKEQGIHWIKAERLPAFLESDLYLEYRLAKLLSQAQIVGEHGEYVLMKIDFVPRMKKEKKNADEEKVQVDPKVALMKDMYVCMGNATTTDTDSWYATAKMATDRETTYSLSSRPPSETVNAKTCLRPTSARPASAFNDPYNRSDSGMGSSMKSSARNSSSATLNQSRYTSSEADQDEIMMSKLFSGDGKQMTPRLTDALCVISKDQSQKRPLSSATVYSTPRSKPIVEFQISETDSEQVDDEKDSGKGDDADENTDFNESISSEGESSKEVVLTNIEDVTSIVVGVVLKTVIGNTTDVAEADIEKIPEIQALLPDSPVSKLPIDMLDKIVLVEEEKVEPVEETKEPEKVEIVSETMKKNMDEESDVDSLLDSEEDYEESDTFFRKHKHRTYNLCSRKGIAQFKRFLKGTIGERNWNFWVDIDRMELMTNAQEIQLYLCGLREKYHNPGAVCELTPEQKMRLGLSEPSAWTQDKLMSIQNNIVEPLVLYWAPRFLLKQLMRTDPDRNLLYQHQKLLKPPPGPQNVYPNPPTATLLPLRPKTCNPRVRQECQVVPHLQPEPRVYPELEKYDTSPPVGMKRTYTEPTIKFILNWQKENSVHTQLISPSLPVERASTPKLRRPASAKTSRSLTTSSPSPRPKSAMVRTNRPSTAGSSSSRLSVESATGRVRIKTPVKSPVDKKPSSRPSSAMSLSSITSDRSVGQESDTSEFFGGRRMEHLLQTLHHEADSGGFFRRYVEKFGKQMWINNLNLWRDVQEYHLLFYAKSLDPYMVRKKAKTIYSQYIVIGAPHHSQCSVDITKEAYAHLNPPFEELFDDAEEHAITVLFDAWHQMWEGDQKTYSKVELIEVKRHLETKSQYVINLQKSGLIKQRVTTPDVMEGYEDPVYDEALIENIPAEFKDYTLEMLVHNRIELEHFRNFLADNYASMDIMCWMDIEAFRRIPHTEEKKRDMKAREIKTKYLNKKYFFGPNSPAGKEGQDKVMEAGGGWGKLLEDRPPNAMILEAQKYVRDRLEKKWLPLFLVTPEFAERQKPHTNMDDVVDDVLVQKKKKSLNMLKLLDSKWVSSSKEIIIFRKALLNPVTNVQFRRFASIKGDSLENDVLFWLEVQKYKDMYHAHTNESMLAQKVTTIINCFIESQLPPTLQIDVSQDIADKIIDRKYEKSPYLFREAQLMVFRILFPHWNEFCDFRANLADEKVLPLIERRRRHAKAKERKRQQEQEEKQAREAERRAAMGLPPLGEDEDVFHDPFKVLDGGESMDGEKEPEDKDKIAWSYSNYMAALGREELLNNTDESSFTSLLTDTASVKSEDSTISRQSDTEKKGSKMDGESQTTAAAAAAAGEKKKSVKLSDKKVENGRSSRSGSMQSHRLSISEGPRSPKDKTAGKSKARKQAM